MPSGTEATFCADLLTSCLHQTKQSGTVEQLWGRVGGMEERSGHVAKGRAQANELRLHPAARGQQDYCPTSHMEVESLAPGVGRVEGDHTGLHRNTATGE